MNARGAITFDTIRQIGEQLPGTETGTAYGSPALRVNGHIYAAIAVNKEVEPNSLAGLSVLPSISCGACRRAQGSPSSDSVKRFREYEATEVHTLTHRVQWPVQAVVIDHVEHPLEN